MLSFDLQAWLLQSCDTVGVLLWILANLWLIPNSNQNKDKTLGFGLLKVVKDWLPSNARTIKINHLISHAYCGQSHSVFSIFDSTKPVHFKPWQWCWEITHVLYHNAAFVVSEVILGLAISVIKLIYIYVLAFFFEILRCTANLPRGLFSYIWIRSLKTEFIKINLKSYVPGIQVDGQAVHSLKGVTTQSFMQGSRQDRNVSGRAESGHLHIKTEAGF